MHWWHVLTGGRLVVDGASMEPAFTAGTRLCVNRWAYWFRAPSPGEVVVLRSPADPSRLELKRVVEIVDGGYFVMGDNRAHSTDSRAYGPVKKSAILGPAILECYNNKMNCA